MVSRIRKFGIMGTKFRNKLKRYDHASDIVSGLEYGSRFGVLVSRTFPKDALSERHGCPLGETI
jgi:hypothetical protein